MRCAAKTAAVLVLSAAILSTGVGPARAEETRMTPLPGGIPMIEGIRMLDVGAEAPDFTIKDVNGVPFHFAEARGGNALLFVFWSIFCEPCRVEMPIIQKLHEKYRGEGLDVVSVSLDGAPLRGSIEGFVKQEGYTFRILIDELDSGEMFKVADPYGVAGTPTVYLVDRSGKVAFARAGRVDEEELEHTVRSLLQK